MDIQYETNQGQRRRNNQDFSSVYYNDHNQVLAIVADGMGGHLAGEVASKMAVEELGTQFLSTSFSTPKEATHWVVTQLQKENERIFKKGKEDSNYLGMGTTIVAVLLLPHHYILAHVGDSRAYVLENEQLTQLTMDHSLVQELVNQGEITPEMAKIHPQKNVVTRSVGMKGLLKVDTIVEKRKENRLLLLCTDGLTNMVSDEEIKTILLSSLTQKEKVNTLIQRANDHGGIDNITALLIDFKKGEPA